MSVYYDINKQCRVFESPKRDIEMESALYDKSRGNESSKSRHENNDIKILVTSPCYDDIGKVLTLMQIPYEQYAPNKSCDMLFVNCGTGDPVDPMKLRSFVGNGGMLYISDLASHLLISGFPGLFNFDGNQGKSGTMRAKVCDAELMEIVGNTVSIYFDLSSWSVLNSINRGKVILSGNANKPIMVHVPYEKGNIFYTCFHNHTQANEKEMTLLKLLIMKQIGEFRQTSIAEVSKEMKVNLAEYRQVFTK